MARVPTWTELRLDANKLVQVQRECYNSVHRLLDVEIAQLDAKLSKLREGSRSKLTRVNNLSRQPRVTPMKVNFAKSMPSLRDTHQSTPKRPILVKKQKQQMDLGGDTITKKKSAQEVNISNLIKVHSTDNSNNFHSLNSLPNYLDYNECDNFNDLPSLDNPSSLHFTNNLTVFDGTSDFHNFNNPQNQRDDRSYNKSYNPSNLSNHNPDEPNEISKLNNRHKHLGSNNAHNQNNLLTHNNLNKTQTHHNFQNPNNFRDHFNDLDNLEHLKPLPMPVSEYFKLNRPNLVQRADRRAMYVRQITERRKQNASSRLMTAFEQIRLSSKSHSNSNNGYRDNRSKQMSRNRLAPNYQIKYRLSEHEMKRLTAKTYKRLPEVKNKLREEVTKHSKVQNYKNRLEYGRKLLENRRQGIINYPLRSNGYDDRSITSSQYDSTISSQDDYQLYTCVQSADPYY